MNDKGPRHLSPWAAGQMCLKHSIWAPRRVRETFKDVGSLGPHLLIKNYKGLYLDLKMLSGCKLAGRCRLGVLVHSPAGVACGGMRECYGT